MFVLLAIAIQSWWRGTLGRRKAAKKKWAVETIRRCVNSNLSPLNGYLLANNEMMQRMLPVTTVSEIFINKLQLLLKKAQEIRILLSQSNHRKLFCDKYLSKHVWKWARLSVWLIWLQMQQTLKNLLCLFFYYYINFHFGTQPFLVIHSILLSSFFL